MAEAPQWKPSEIHRLMKSVIKILGEARMGVRTDILLGMFMFSVLDNQMPLVPETVKAVPPSTIEHQPPAVKTPVEVKEDPALKEEVLAMTHEKNFAAFCALYDSRPVLRGNDLILDMAHRYNYTVMKIDRNAAELSEIFGEYKSVILRFGSAEYTCPRRLSVSHEVHEPVKEAPKHIEFEIPVAQEKPVQQSSSSSAFADIIRGLSAMGLNPEVILRRQTESEEAESDDNIMEGETEE